VNRPCPEFEPLLLDRAAGVLEPAREAGLVRHLAGCPSCRAEAETVERALSLAALPPLPDAEKIAVAQGAREALLAHRAGRKERRLAGSLAFALAASAAFAVAVPWYLLSRHAPVAPPVVTTAVVTTAAWDLPDLDAAWAASAVADPDGSPEAEPEMLFAELQEIDLDLE